MENSDRFYANEACQYYPCHGMEEQNCKFCYCPLYFLECPGNPTYFVKRGKRLKDCTDCTFPHDPKNYDEVIEVLKKAELTDLTPKGDEKVL